jgi:hypothetical protein
VVRFGLDNRGGEFSSSSRSGGSGGSGVRVAARPTGMQPTGIPLQCSDSGNWSPRCKYKIQMFKSASALFLRFIWGYTAQIEGRVQYGIDLMSIRRL